MRRICFVAQLNFNIKYLWHPPVPKDSATFLLVEELEPILSSLIGYQVGSQEFF